MSEDRWAQFTPREREIIRFGLNDVLSSDDPDEEIQQQVRDAEKLYDELEE